MKNFKKLLTLGLTLGALTLLGACQNQDTKTETSQSSTTEVAKIEATLVIQEDGKDIATKEVKVKEGTTVYDAMADVFEVVDDKGFITSIDGHQQDEKAGKYWMYDVNGEMAPKGAKETVLAKGDKVEFNLQEVK